MENVEDRNDDERDVRRNARNDLFLPFVCEAENERLQAVGRVGDENSNDSESDSDETFRSDVEERVGFRVENLVELERGRERRVVYRRI